MFNNRLYFGTRGGVIVEAETGGTDRGQAYSATIVWPFAEFKAGGAFKVAQLARPFLESSVDLAPLVSVQSDYVLELPSAPSTPTQGSNTTLWDQAKWDEARWPGAVSRSGAWYGVEGTGTALAGALQLTNATPTTPIVTLSRMDLVYQVGDVVT